MAPTNKIDIFISVSASFGYKDQIQHGGQHTEIQLPDRDTHLAKGGNYEVGNRWLHRGWHGDDQMAGLVAPAEMRHDVAGHLGVEGVHQHHPHDDHGSTHSFHVNMTLVSEMNGTVHDWPWPTGVATHKK